MRDRVQLGVTALSRRSWPNKKRRTATVHPLFGAGAPDAKNARA